MNDITASDRAAQLNRMISDTESCGSLVEDAAHWAYYDVHTGVELDMYLAFCEYVDMYKEVHGIKPRWLTWKDESASDWRVKTTVLFGIVKFEEEARIAEEAWSTATLEAARAEPVSLTYNPFTGLKLA